ncbi:MAG TPA: M20 family metallopeptidase [Arthrobacter sp.]|nr:M20 family metallopeptidase [Arthrobacter sp.]
MTVSDTRQPTRTQELAADLAAGLISFRRELHRIPELGNELPLTQRRLLAELQDLGLDITLGESLSSVTAVLRGEARPASGTKPVVLLRGDMDALPVTEDNGLDYKSSHTGLMHACGHDMHVAGLVGAARILTALKADLAGDVVFMFQPGEEGPGGALPMIEEGVLMAAGRRVDAAFGLHVFSAAHPRGVWFGRPGPEMAAVDDLHVRFTGSGGHGSQPHHANDPIPALCEAVTALQTMVTRAFDVFDPVVLTVGRIAGGTRENIIPEDAAFDATVRSFSAESRAAIKEKSVRLLEGIAAAHGLEATVDYHELYPVTENAPAEFELARQTIVDMFGEDRYQPMPNPMPGAEDFSFVANEVPSAYLFLSACAHDDPADAGSNHSPHALFDDSVLPDAASWLAEVALRRINQGL